MIANFIIWITGSLSIAVLLARAHNLTLSPIVYIILDEHDQMMSMMFALLAAPWITTFAQQFNATIGTGATLLPHSCHIFALATLHMLPQSYATYGIGGVRAKVLWVLQAIGAILAGALIAAFVGSQPFLVEGNAGDWAVCFLVAAALGANVLNDALEEEKEAESASEDEEERKRTLSFSLGAFLTALLLALFALGAVALMLGFIDHNESERLFFYVLVPLFFLRLLVGIASGKWRDADDSDDILFDQGPLTGIARVALLLGAVALSDFAMPGGRSLASFFILLVGGGLLFGVFYAGRRIIDRVFARTTYDPPYPAALGLFLLGGAALLGADLIATTSR